MAYSAPSGVLTQFLGCSYSEGSVGEHQPHLHPHFSGVQPAGFHCVLLHQPGFVLNPHGVHRHLMPSAPPSPAPLWAACPYQGARILSKSGAMIAGYEALDHFDDAGALALNVNELFEDGSMTLHGIKAFADQRIDEAIVDAVSVIAACGGLLTDILYADDWRQEELLKPVDDLVYEGWYGPLRLGRRQTGAHRQQGLMLNHEIRPLTGIMN